MIFCLSAVNNSHEIAGLVWFHKEVKYICILKMSSAVDLSKCIKGYISSVSNSSSYFMFRKDKSLSVTKCYHFFHSFVIQLTVFNSNFNALPHRDAF